MWEPSSDHSLLRLFAGLTEQTFFGRLGFADPQLVDYLSGLLARFVHCDEMYRLRGGEGKPITDLAHMVREANTLPEGGRTRWEYYRHIGDVSLFWAGLYPEALQRDRATWGDHAVMNYTTCGKRSYWIASQYEDGEPYSREAPVLKRLSEQFELCATGLREVRREWEEAAEGPHARPLIH